MISICTWIFASLITILLPLLLANKWVEKWTEIKIHSLLFDHRVYVYADGGLKIKFRIEANVRWVVSCKRPIRPIQNFFRKNFSQLIALPPPLSYVCVCVFNPLVYPTADIYMNRAIDIDIYLLILTSFTFILIFCLFTWYINVNCSKLYTSTSNVSYRIALYYLYSFIHSK